MLKRISIIGVMLLMSICLLVSCKENMPLNEKESESINPYSINNNPSSYPVRPINVIIPFDAGGDTDIWNRKLVNLIAKETGWEILTSNLAGGVSGSAGTAYVWNQPHEGYFIAGTSETPLLIPVMTETTNQLTDDWEYWIAGGSLGLLCVNNLVSYDSLNELIEAEQRGEEVEISSTSGGLWFLLANLCSIYSEIDFDSATYAGSASAIEACIAGETTAVAASAGELAEYILKGELTPIAVFDKDTYTLEGYGEIDSIVTHIPSLEEHMNVKQFLGFMIPADTPKEVIIEIDQAFKKVMTSEELKLFAQQQYAKIYNLSGEEAREMCAEAQATMSWILEDMEMTKKSPEQVGIKRP